MTYHAALGLISLSFLTTVTILKIQKVSFLPKAGTRGPNICPSLDLVLDRSNCWPLIPLDKSFKYLLNVPSFRGVAVITSAKHKILTYHSALGLISFPFLTSTGKVIAKVYIHRDLFETLVPINPRKKPHSVPSLTPTTKPITWSETIDLSLPYQSFK